MRTRIQRAVPWHLTIAWAGVIFYASSRPGSTLPGGWSVQGHLGEYFVLGGLLSWALANRRIGATTVALAVLLASLYGITDEFHQHFVAMRTPDIADWILDTIGATAGALAVGAFAKYWALREISTANDQPSSG